MNKKERAMETGERIKAEVVFYNNKLPVNVNLVWQGYIGALLESSLIEVEDHTKFIAMLPSIKHNPVASIFMGKPGYHIEHE